jgi:SAM-dependent methyltransferase
MHDTAMHIGKLFFEIYCLSTGVILEIGSRDINGTLRSVAPKGYYYLGADQEVGQGVDVVVSPHHDFPIAEQSIDCVLASSVFEHDAFFWETFIRAAQLLKNGGYLYINSPSNGWVHRYPADYWRFYPDSGLALERWGRRAGVIITMVESFVADRKMDVWNDFVAVFQMTESPTLHERLIQDSIPNTNARRWDRPGEILNDLRATEDMRLMNATGVGV